VDALGAIARHQFAGKLCSADPEQRAPLGKQGRAGEINYTKHTKHRQRQMHNKHNRILHFTPFPHSTTTSGGRTDIVFGFTVDFFE
jgi:hypothetical protein